MTDLLPCPFCGARPELIEADTGAKDVWLVRCTWCQVKTVNHYGNVTPVLIWNRRSPALPQADLFIHIQPKADSCDHVWDGEEPIEHDGVVTGSTLVCSKCKMTAFEHSLRYSE